MAEALWSGLGLGLGLWLCWTHSLSCLVLNQGARCQWRRTGRARDGRGVLDRVKRQCSLCDALTLILTCLVLIITPTSLIVTLTDLSLTGPGLSNPHKGYSYLPRPNKQDVICISYPDIYPVPTGCDMCSSSNHILISTPSQQS